MSAWLIVIIAALAAVVLGPLATLLILHLRRRLVRRSYRRVIERIAPPGRPLGHECPLCGAVFDVFVEGDDPDESGCPTCGSLPGDRLLSLYLLNETDLLGDREQRRVSQLGLARCWQIHAASVLGEQSEAEPGDQDVILAALDLQSGPEIRDMVEELERQLKPERWAVVHVPEPASEGSDDAPEPPEATPDAADVLAAAGFQVTVDHYPRRLPASSRLRFGLRDGDQILFCRRLPSGRRGYIEHLWTRARDAPPRVPLPGRQPLFVGRVEEVRDGVVLGWAWCPTHPGERVKVHVVVDGARVASGIASTIRPSLAWGGIGDGRHVFQVQLPRRLAKRGRHRLRVEPESGVALPSATNFKATAPKQPKLWGGVQFAVEGYAFGRVERVQDGIVSGWVWSPEAPTWKLGLKVVVDGQPVAKGIAELPRPGFGVAEPDRGRYGFRIPLPQVAAGAHALRVEIDRRFPGTGPVALLPAATFTTGVTNSAFSWGDVELVVESDLVGVVEGVRDHVVQGWVWDPARNRHRARVRIVVDGRETGGAVASLHDPGLESSGIGDGRHAFRFRLPDSLASLGRHSLRVEAEDGVALPGCGSFTIIDGLAQGIDQEEPRRRISVGRIERVTNGAVMGWAMAPHDSDDPLGIRVLIDGREVCAGVAIADPLDAEGNGSVRHRRFTIELPRALAGRGLQQLRVETDGGAVIPAAAAFGTVANGNGGRAWRGASFIVERAVLGRVEELRNGVVSGWAWRPGAPLWRVAVRALLDGQEVASGIADLERPSLEAAGIGDGRHGFRLQIPLPQGEGPHRLRIEAEDVPLPPANAFGQPRDDDARWNDVSLSVDGSAKGRNAAAIVGQLEGLRNDAVRGWACSPTAPEWRLWIRTTVDGEESGGAYADLDSDRAVGIEAGDGRYGFNVGLSPRPALGAPRYLRLEAGREVTLPVAREFEYDGSGAWRIVVSPARYR